MKSFDYDFDNVYLFIHDGGDLYRLDDDVEQFRRFTKDEAIAFAESNGYEYQFKEVN
jgi:hypothetical protein